MLSNSNQNDYLGRTSLVTIKNRGRPPACVACIKVGKGTTPAFFVSGCVHEPQAQGSTRPKWAGRNLNISAAHSSTTNPLTATALIYAFGAEITANAGTRLILQLLLDVGWV